MSTDKSKSRRKSTINFSDNEKDPKKKSIAFKSISRRESKKRVSRQNSRKSLDLDKRKRSRSLSKGANNNKGKKLSIKNIPKIVQPQNSPPQEQDKLPLNIVPEDQGQDYLETDYESNVQEIRQSFQSGTASPTKTKSLNDDQLKLEPDTDADTDVTKKVKIEEPSSPKDSTDDMSVHPSELMSPSKGLYPVKNEKSTNFTRLSSIRSLSSSHLKTMEGMDGMSRKLTQDYENDHGYEKIKQVYQEILQQLGHHEDGHVCLEPIRDEFTMLWEGIEASHDNELNLIKKDEDLSVQLSTTMAKTKCIIKLAEDDSQLAWKLGQNLEKAWALADIGDETEASNLEKLERLQQDIFDLNRNINAASHVEGQDTMKELHRMKNELVKQRDGANIEASKYRSSLNILFAKRQELFERRTSLEEKNNLLDEEYQAQNEAIERETERKKRLAIEMGIVEEKLDKKQNDLQDLEQQIQTTANKIIDTERDLMEQNFINEGAMREQDLSVNRLEKLKNDFELQQKLVERLTMVSYRQVQDLKSKEGEINFLRMELNRGMRQRSLNMKRVIILQQAMTTLDIERESLKNKINLLEKELEKAQKKLDLNKKKVERLDKERSFVNRNLKRADAVTAEHSSQAITHEIAVQNLSDSVNLYKDEIYTQKMTINRLENERDFYSLESTKMAQQLAFQLTELKKLDLSIFKYKKKLGTIDAQLKKTQQTYDLALYDKGVFERTLSDTLTEMLENGTKIKHLNNQISSIKYQLNQKDETIHQEALRYDRIQKETEFFTRESKRIQRMAQDIQRHTEGLETERSTLGCSIAEIESELGKESSYASAAESRGQVFHRKLMDQDVQLRKYWENWRTLNSKVRIGYHHYRTIVKDIYQIRYNIISTRRLQDSKKKNMTNSGRLRREMRILGNCIARENCMINALTEQMKHPLNVHRWRVLEATNPQAYEMILKINLLTRRLVERNGILKEQSRQLEEKEGIYVEIRNSLSRSPGLETPEEVVYYQHLLVAKKQQLNNLEHELRAGEAQTMYYRDLVKKLNERMKSLKINYFKKLKGNYHQNNSICQLVNHKNKFNRHLILQQQNQVVE